MFKGEFKQNKLPPYSPINPSASLGKFFYFSNNFPGPKNPETYNSLEQLISI